MDTEARFGLFTNPVTARYLRRLAAAGTPDGPSPLPAATQELVKIRASQINGCAACLDQHTKDAAHAGESPVRLSLVTAWREATVVTEAERAAPGADGTGPPPGRRGRRRSR